jgi:hypothetical protein
MPRASKLSRHFQRFGSLSMSGDHFSTDFASPAEVQALASGGGMESLAFHGALLLPEEVERLLEAAKSLE